MSKFIHVSHNSSTCTCNKHPEILTCEMLNPLVKKILFHCEKGENKIQFEKVSKDSTVLNSNRPSIRSFVSTCPLGKRFGNSV